MGHEYLTYENECEAEDKIITLENHDLQSILRTYLRKQAFFFRAEVYARNEIR